MNTERNIKNTIKRMNEQMVQLTKVVTEQF